MREYYLPVKNSDHLWHSKPQGLSWDVYSWMWDGHTGTPCNFDLSVV